MYRGPDAERQKGKIKKKKKKKKFNRSSFIRQLGYRLSYRSFQSFAQCLVVTDGGKKRRSSTVWGPRFTSGPPTTDCWQTAAPRTRCSESVVRVTPSFPPRPCTFYSNIWQEVDSEVFFLTLLQVICHVSAAYLSSACSCHGYDAGPRRGLLETTKDRLIATGTAPVFRK